MLGVTLPISYPLQVDFRVSHLISKCLWESLVPVILLLYSLCLRLKTVKKKKKKILGAPGWLSGSVG